MKLFIYQQNNLIQKIKLATNQDIFNLIIRIYSKTFYKCENFNHACFNNSFKWVNAILDTFIHLNKVFLHKNHDQYIKDRIIHSLVFDQEDINLLDTKLPNKIVLKEKEFYNLKIKDSHFSSKIKTKNWTDFIEWNNNFLKSCFLHQSDLQITYQNFEVKEQQILKTKVQQLVNLNINPHLEKLFEFILNDKIKSF